MSFKPFAYVVPPSTAVVAHRGDWRDLVFRPFTYFLLPSTLSDASAHSSARGAPVLRDARDAADAA